MIEKIPRRRVRPPHMNPRHFKRKPTGQQQTCDLKRRYETERAARKATKRIGQMRHYRCHVCGCWHLTRTTTL